MRNERLVVQTYSLLHNLVDEAGCKFTALRIALNDNIDNSLILVFPSLVVNRVCGRHPDVCQGLGLELLDLGSPPADNKRTDGGWNGDFTGHLEDGGQRYEI